MDLTSVDLDSVGVVGLVVLFALALGRGWIVTKRQLDDVIHDRDEWRSESRLKDAQLAEKDDQLGYLSEVGRTVTAIMQAIKSGPRDEVT